MARKHRIVSFTADPRPVVRMAQKALSPQRMSAANRRIGQTLVLKIASYIYDRSKTRHKTADRLGAQHTGTLEFSRSCPAYTRRGGKIDFKVHGGIAEVVISGVAGLARAFKNLDIYPRKAHALTIPCDAESYAKTARQMTDKGWNLFVPRRRGDGEQKGALWGTKGGITKPLYLLRHHVKVKRDARLLPTNRMVSDWALQGLSEYMETAGL